MGFKILSIDDDKILSSATAKLLEKKGHSIDLVHSGEEGKNQALVEDYDLILLDIEMPEVSGVDVLRHIREFKNKAELPVIMVTAIEGWETVVEALEIGANDYIEKPVQADVLNARIQTQVELKKLSQEFAKKKEVEALNAMITTYNHEINNPLTIAFGMVEIMNKKQEFSPEQFEKLKKSLERVRDIVQKIRSVTEDDNVNFDDYVKGASKMVKI